MSAPAGAVADNDNKKPSMMTADGPSLEVVTTPPSSDSPGKPGKKVYWPPGSVLPTLFIAKVMNSKMATTVTRVILSTGKELGGIDARAS
jgi:hypothetical protein